MDSLHQPLIARSLVCLNAVCVLCIGPGFSARFLTVTEFVRVWRNECLRVFHDRLINEKDKTLVISGIYYIAEDFEYKHTKECTLPLNGITSQRPNA